MSEQRKSFGGLILLAFLFGIAAGAGAMRMYFTHTLGSWNPSQRFVAKLDQDLGLDADQRRRMAAVLDGQKERMEELRALWNVDVRILAREGEDLIGASLTAPQLDRFMKAHDEIHGWMTRFLWTTDTGSTAIAVAPEKR